MGRLGGKSRQIHTHVQLCSKLHIWKHATMQEALRQSKRRVWAGNSDRDERVWLAIGTRPVDGDKERLNLAVERSEGLVDDAIAFDPRLAKKAQWLRRDEGEHCDSALLAQGDDQPFYKRCRNIINDETKAGEPVRIVVSTDDNNVPDGAAAAFIATVRIVQQFVPVEVWWQGAWLNESRTKGFVFHVPLVQGDMDFSRLDYCISDETRDNLSFRVMSAQAVNEYHEVWNECGERAERSYLHDWNDGDQWLNNFVAHRGISPSADSIAYHAARWIGLEPLWKEERKEAEAASGALQSIPEPPKPYVDTRTPDEIERDRRNSEKYWAEDKARRQKEANQRLQAV
jgi:hypothetical protein